MKIRPATSADSADIEDIHRLAFGGETEPMLVRAILADRTAVPVVSLGAIVDRRAVGHILLSAARLETMQRGVTAALLAPLAVLPAYQGRGIGGQLVAAGLQAVRGAGADLVFVLGDPRYYRRHGFEPASPRGFDSPFPVPGKYADAWMVRALTPGVFGTIAGRVRCCAALDRAEIWQG